MAVLGKNIWGPGPSSFGRQPRLSEITIEPISGVLPKKLDGYMLETWHRAASAERWKREDREAWGSWGTPSSPADLGIWGASWAPPAGSGAKPRPPTHSRHISGPQNPSSRNNALRNQSKIWGAWARFGGPAPPWPQPKTATADNLHSYPPDNHHSSDDVYWRAGEVSRPNDCHKCHFMQINSLGQKQYSNPA